MRYYKLNVGRLPLGLVWSWGSLPGFLAFLVFYKLLRVRKYGPVLVPAQPGVLRIPEGEARVDDHPGLEAASAELTKAGLVPAMYYTTETIGPVSGLTRVFLSPDGRFAALAMSSKARLSSETSVSLVSVADDGAIIGTGSTILRLPQVPGTELVRIPGAPPAELISHHVRRLDSRAVRQLAVEDVVQLLDEQQLRTIKHDVSIGLYEPATDSDVAGGQA